MANEIDKWGLIMRIEKGNSGESVKEIQKLLGLTIDGEFGAKTEAAVKKFQSSRGLLADGIVGNKTYAAMIAYTSDVSDGTFIDNDGILDDRGTYTTSDGLIIHKMYMDTDEYVTDAGTTDKDTLFIHHTAGRSNPFKTVKNWNLDTRGRIATQYCIGGKSINGDTENDGVVVEAFPDEYYAWHLGKVGSHHMHKHSVGIELNNWGYLYKDGDDYYNYVDIKVPKEQVVKLRKKFNGHYYYHMYSDAQLAALKLLIYEIKRRHPKININLGLPQMLMNMDEFEAFGFNKAAYNGEINGILTHTNVRRDKTDCYPDSRLVAMLKSL